MQNVSFIPPFVMYHLTYLLLLLRQNKNMSRLNLLGANIKKFRKQKKLSQNQLAEILDFSREHIACIETGKEFISLRKLFQLADVLEMPVKDFFDFD